jgi:hypothetical protein
VGRGSLRFCSIAGSLADAWRSSRCIGFWGDQVDVAAVCLAGCTGSLFFTLPLVFFGCTAVGLVFLVLL